MANPEDIGIAKVEAAIPQIVATVSDVKDKAPSLATKQQSTIQSAPAKPEVAAESSKVSVKEENCYVLDRISTHCRSGKGEFRRLVIPPNTKPGLYSIVLSDAVNRSLYLDQTVSEDRLLPGHHDIESMIALPNALDNMYKVLRPLADDTTSRIVITNELELCK